MKLRTSLLSLASAGAVLLSTSAAGAALNNYNCHPAAGKYPVVIAHGQQGHAEDLGAIIAALEGGGWCVFGEDYGRMAAGSQTGRAHLDQAGGEYAGVVDKVMKATGAQKVDAVGYSEGGMVVDNFILKKGGATKVNRFVGFAPGHHAYAHFGIPKIFDGVLYAPNVELMVKNMLPPFTTPITIQQVIKGAMLIGGGMLDANTNELVQSDFVADLFNAEYWRGLFGGLPEPAHIIAYAGDGKTFHTYPTKDSAPTVCYTNMVSTGDMLVGQSAGFQDAAPNVDNQVLLSAADHNTIVGEKAAIDMMVKALNTPCVQSPGGGPATATPESQLNGGSSVDGGQGPANAETDDDRDGYDATVASSGCGCKVVPAPASTTFQALLGLGIAAAALSWRRGRR